MRWILPQVDDAKATLLARELALHPVAAAILFARGYQTAADAESLFKDSLNDLPDPSRMKGMDAAAARLAKAIAGGEKIALYGDYDVDGVTSTALLSGFLRTVGATVSWHIPLRAEGYGLNVEAIEHIAAEGARVLVSLDCGITALKEIDRARALGLEVIVVDHHQLAPSLPAAVAVIDPNQPGCEYPSKDLCTAGLAFLLAVALRRTLRLAGHFASRHEPNLRESLDLVALGTVADVVPLVGVNRILVKHGLLEIAKGRRVGVSALKSVARIVGAPTAGQVAFRLAPRLNAAGRVADAAAAVELLSTSDPAEAERLARQLDAANLERQEIERRILEEALKDAATFPEARSLVLARDGWHAGVIGIVASRVVERFHRPTFVVALDGESGKGSGRSVEGFHLHQALVRCSSHLIRFGGHKHAAGLSIRADAIDGFRAALEVEARAALGDAPLEGRCRIDAVVQPSQLDRGLADALAQLAPFGAGNPEPVLASFGLKARARVVTGKNGGAAHLKLALESAPQLDVIGFGLGEQSGLAARPLDAAFQLEVDEYQGLSRLSLRLKDVRPATSAGLT